MHSFHLVTVPAAVGARWLLRGPSGGAVPGLDHAESLASMRLGAPVVTPDRLQLRRLAAVARWRDKSSLERFLQHDERGRLLAAGWHVRRGLLRRWSTIEALPGLPVRAGRWEQDEPVVVTLARTSLPQLPRFLRWDRPVERQVRDHAGVTLGRCAPSAPDDLDVLGLAQRAGHGPRPDRQRRPPIGTPPRW